MEQKAITKIRLEFKDRIKILDSVKELQYHQQLFCFAANSCSSFSKREYDVLIIDLHVFMNRLHFSDNETDVRTLLSFIKSLTLIEQKFVVATFPDWKLLYDVVRRAKSVFCNILGDLYEAGLLSRS